MSLSNYFRSWNDRNIKILMNNSVLLTKETKNKLNIFTKARDRSLITRIMGFIKCKIYRQTLFGNITLFIGGILNKI
jgi:hypothetical protein